MKSDVAKFLGLSAALTGFSETDLLGTGMIERYFQEVRSIVGEAVISDLLRVGQTFLSGRPDKNVWPTLLHDDRLGPIARNIISMWYLGSWSRLPDQWRAKYGSSDADTDHIVSTDAYVEGLVWTAIGAHPPGAKQPGFGSWALPPRVRGDR